MVTLTYICFYVILSAKALCHMTNIYYQFSLNSWKENFKFMCCGDDIVFLATYKRMVDLLNK